MHTRSGVTQRLLAALTIRPASPGLMVVGGLLLAAISGWPLVVGTWFWPVIAAAVVLAVVLNTARQDILRRIQSNRHQQRMATANALLNDHPPGTTPGPEITGSIRELGGLVERFGHQLDDLLTEVHAEKSSADQRSHRS